MHYFAEKPLQRQFISDLIQKYAINNDHHRVIIADDDRTSSEIYKSLISTNFNNYAVKLAKNGVEACALIGSFKPDTIILDLNMPDMNGIEVLKFIISYATNFQVLI